MSYELVQGLEQSEWNECVSILGLYDGALGQREDNKGGTNMHDIKSPEEAAAIIGKTNVNGKELLIEYCKVLESAYKKDPESAIDRMSEVGVLKDFESFKKDRQHLKEAMRSDDGANTIEDMDMDSLFGDELKPDAINQALAQGQARAEAAKAETKKILDEIQMKNDAELPPSNDHLIDAMEDDAKAIAKVADNMNVNDVTPVNEQTIRDMNERQKRIGAAIQREKAYRFYWSPAGKALIASYQQSMAWVSAKSAGRKKPTDFDRRLAAETIKQLKESHAYGRRKFAIELVLTKGRSEASELKKNPEFVKLGAKEVFNTQNLKASRALDGRYSARQEIALNKALEKSELQRKKELDNDKNKK